MKVCKFANDTKLELAVYTTDGSAVIQRQAGKTNQYEPHGVQQSKMPGTALGGE